MTKDQLEKATDLEFKINCLSSVESNIKNQPISLSTGSHSSINLLNLLSKDDRNRLKKYILKMIRAEKRAAQAQFNKL